MTLRRSQHGRNFSSSASMLRGTLGKGNRIKGADFF